MNLLFGNCMRASALALVSFSSLPAVPADQAGQEADCPPATAVVESDATSSALMMPLPGIPVSFALPLSADGSRQILILIPPPEIEEEDRLLKEKVRQGLASGDLERSLRAADRDHETSSELDIDLPDDDEGPAEFQQAIRSALSAYGVVLGGIEPVNQQCQAQPVLPLAGLYLLVPGAQPELRLLRADLPAGATALAAIDLDGDHVDELILEHDGAVDILPFREDGMSDGDLIPLFRDPQLRLRALEPGDVLFPPEPLAVRSPLDEVEEMAPRDDPPGPGYVSLDRSIQPLHLRVTDLGALRLYGPDAGTESWSLQATVDLPTRTLPDKNMLLLAGPEVRTIGRSMAGHFLLAAGPVPYGDQRLRTLVISLEDLHEPVLQDIWSRLEPGEVVSASGFVMLDGEPHLWVQTENTDQIEFFGDNETLRIYHLTLDRSRAGVRPVLSFEKIKPFQDTRKKFGMDVNADGRDDLLFIARSDGNVTLSAYLRKKNGDLASSPRQQQIPGGGRPVEFGEDLDGDRLPDLVLEDAGTVSIHSGLQQNSGGKQMILVSPTPTWMAALRRPTRSSPDGVRCSDDPVLVDTDGDHRRERLCLGVDDGGNPYFKILTFTSRRTSSPAQ